LLPLSSQFWVGQLVEFWLAGVPDGWVSIPILTRLPTVGNRADGLPPSPLYTAGAALVGECARESMRERRSVGRRTDNVVVC